MAPINLIDSSVASIDMGVTVGVNRNSLKLLTDDNENISLTLSGNEETSIEIVCYFGGALVSPEKLIMQISNIWL